MSAAWFDIRLFLLGAACLWGVSTKADITENNLQNDNETTAVYTLTFSTCDVTNADTTDTVEVLLIGRSGHNVTLQFNGSQNQPNKSQGIFARGATFRTERNTTDIGKICQMSVHRLCTNDGDGWRLANLTVLYREDLAEFRVSDCHVSEDEGFVEKGKATTRFNRSEGTCHSQDIESDKPPEGGMHSHSSLGFTLMLALLGLALVIVIIALVSSCGRAQTPETQARKSSLPNDVTSSKIDPDECVQQATRKPSLLYDVISSKMNPDECVHQADVDVNPADVPVADFLSALGLAQTYAIPMDEMNRLQCVPQTRCPSQMSWRNNSLYVTADV